MQIPYVRSNETVIRASSSTAITLKAGDIVTGEVLSSSEQTATVRLNNAVITVKTAVPLQPGTVLSFLVESVDNEIRLKLFGTPMESPVALNNALMEALGTMKGSLIKLQELATLQHLLSQLPEDIKRQLPNMGALYRFSPDPASLKGETLKQGIESSGIFYESRLRALTLRLVNMEEQGMDIRSEAMSGMDQIIRDDLKGVLLSIKTLLQKPDMAMQPGLGRANGIISLVDRMIQQIQYQQLQSKISGVLQSFVPFVWKELKEGEFVFRDCYSSENGEREYSCIVNLDLEKVGKLVVHITMRPDLFHLRFITENKLFQGFLQESTPLLEKQFQSADLKLGSVTMKHENKILFRNVAPEGFHIMA